MGIFLSQIKHLAPLALYALGIVLFFMGLAGKGQWPLLLVIFLIPLRNIADRLQEFPLGNQFIDILILGAMLGWFISVLNQQKPLFEHSVINSILVVLLLYTFFSLLLGSNYLHKGFSLSFSDDRVKNWKNFCLMPLLFFITFNHVRDRVWIERILMTMICAIFLVEYYTMHQIHWYSALISREKISGTFQFLGPNEVAAFFNGYTVIMMSVFLFLKEKKIKWLLFIMILINIFCILCLYSRGAYLGLFAGMFFLFLFKNRKFLIILILVGLLWQSILPEKVVERIKQTKDEYGQLDVSSQERIVIWKQALALFQKSPLTGIGFGVFHTLGLALGDTHNIYIKYLTEQGLIGLAIFLIVILCFLRIGYILYKKGEDDLSKGMGLGLMACIVVFMVNNLFGDRWAYFELGAYLWVFAGLAARLIILAQSPDPLPKVEVQEKIKIVSPNMGQKKKKKLRYYDL